MIYSVTEFRKNIREILDAVDAGADVQIQRYDRLYSIKNTVHGDSALPVTIENAVRAKVKPGKKVYEGELVSAEKVEVVKSPKQRKLDAAVARETNLCEHGQVKGRCMVKKCKYGSKA